MTCLYKLKFLLESQIFNFLNNCDCANRNFCFDGPSRNDVFIDTDFIDADRDVSAGN